MFACFVELVFGVCVGLGFGFMLVGLDLELLFRLVVCGLLCLGYGLLFCYCLLGWLLVVLFGDGSLGWVLFIVLDLFVFVGGFAYLLI